MKDIYRAHSLPYAPSLAAFILTALILAIAHIKLSFPILLLERFIPGGGWFEILLLSIYAGFITEKMLDVTQSAKWRHRIWWIFSAVFFTQLIIGLIGIEKLLMTGKLHLPIPTLIVAGPIYRGENYFMPILFIATIILVGPAWCSHLCYIGAWDDFASRGRKKSKKMPAWRQQARIAILLIVIATAIILRALGVSTFAAGGAALIFGLVGVAIMIFWSRKMGVMTHCVTFCPMGPLANWLGRISPFRIKINDSTCTDCAICHTACRYDALNTIDIKNRKPNISCTLCGDCLGTCQDGALEYHFLSLKGKSARILFIVLVVSLHAVFMGVARM
jgi:polyferredoxin